MNDYLLQTSSQVKEITYYICPISQKQKYRNNMEPKGTSQQESGGVWSFLKWKMSEFGVSRNEYKQMVTRRVYLGSPL